MDMLARNELGYHFYPPADPHDLGHPQLDVIIHPAPTGEHFDPERLICPVAVSTGSTALHVLHPWTQELSFRMCAGDVIIEDRTHAQIKTFTFGGKLAIESDPRRTICHLTSPVSLLEHSLQPTALGQILIDEVNILFAERRATQDEDAFAQHLAAADPVQLYRACLLALRDKFEHFPTLDEPHKHFRQYLQTTTAAFTEEPPLLSQLL